jgi:hypothetical protein
MSMIHRLTMTGRITARPAPLFEERTTGVKTEPTTYSPLVALGRYRNRPNWELCAFAHNPKGKLSCLV